MIELRTPRGLPVSVPESREEDPSPRFMLDRAGEARKYYDEHGYVVFRNLLPAQACEQIRGLWEREVKPFDGFMYRQATARAERHAKNPNGWIMNPILNLQSLDPAKFPGMRQFATEQVLTSPALVACFRLLLGEAPKLVQSMYFEGNSATWEHQDSYYLDSEKVGEMAAAWIAVEDIGAAAGRFFICPGSHRISLRDHSLLNNIAGNHEAYIQSVVREIRERKLEIRAPRLNQGDVLFWNSLTIHGSLDSQDAHRSRSSITCHAIPASRRFLQLQTRVLDLPAEDFGSCSLYRPKDLARPANRAVLLLESRFPRAFYWLKKQAIVSLMRLKGARGPREVGVRAARNPL
ncbi:MAG TPA: phytanoyl-CoA dioxygenase family protein [Steroidobacteraceae bacterium]|nr:phytanoyl-CoA dioxygenase family protein [Steroidobacteraceae bacterium]